MADNVDSQNKRIYDSYAAMDRPAMFADIPILPGLLLFLLGLITLVAVTSMYTLFWGVICSAPFVMAIVALRVMTEFDDKIMRRVSFMFARLRLNMLHGRHLFLSPINSQWSQEYAKRHAQLCIRAEQAQSSENAVPYR